MAQSTKLTRRCNLGCSYCYQTTARVVKNATAAHDYDIDAILETLGKNWDIEDEHGGAQPAVIHGGEPLLAKKKDLERLFRVMYERFGRCSIQTNGVLIDQDHLDMFGMYNVHCGVSIDGWGHLNISRQQSGDVAATLDSTRKTLDNMQRLIDIDRTPGLIVVLSRANATEELLPMDGLEPGDRGYYEEPITRRDALFDFLEFTVDTWGLSPGRLNPAHVDVPWVQPIVQLSNDELSNFWLALVPWAFGLGYKFKQIEEVRDALFGLGQQSCTKTYCDPLHTLAEQPVQSDGEVGNCEHVYGTDGIPFQQATDGKITYERYEILVGTDWKHGGCFNGPDGESEGACKWWAICNGQCPGQAIDGDWRNRTRFCESWAVLYQAVYDQTKRMFPNVQLLPDVAGNFNPHDLYHAIHNCDPPWEPFALQKRQVTRRPSFWKPDAGWSLQDGLTLESAVIHKKDVTVGPSTGDNSHGDVAHGDHTDNETNTIATLHGDHVDNGTIASTPTQYTDPDHGDAEHGDHADHGDSG